MVERKKTGRPKARKAASPRPSFLPYHYIHTFTVRLGQALAHNTYNSIFTFVYTPNEYEYTTFYILHGY